jgi:hypothetical protein
MGIINVPRKIVDNVYEPFPEGTYYGTLAEVELRKNPDGTWAGLEVSFVNVEPVNDSPEDGRPFSDTITIRARGESLVDQDDFTTLPKELFGLRLGAGQLAGLAEAFGAGEGSEEGVALDLEDFIEQLQDGTFRGKEAGFVTRQRTRTYKNDAGEEVSIVETNARQFMLVE